MTENELRHYGVRGMKWGVRRYQKENGTLTSAGKVRYKDTSSDSKSTKSKTKSPSKTKKSSAAKKKQENVTAELAKTAVKRSAFALGTAAVGSVATKALVDKGKIEAASIMYAISKDTFRMAAKSARVNAGAAALSTIVTGPKFVKEHLKGKK